MFRLRRRLSYLAERAALAGHYFGGDLASRWSESTRLVFVCTGNICRSPYAEFVARGRGLPAISCGTNTRNDLPADALATEEAARRGVDMRAHRTSRWQDMQVHPTDIIVATQLTHAMQIRKRALQLGCQTLLLSSFLLPEFQVVWDPYGQPIESYVTAFNEIERAIARIFQLLEPVLPRA